MKNEEKNMAQILREFELTLWKESLLFGKIEGDSRTVDYLIVGDQTGYYGNSNISVETYILTEEKCKGGQSYAGMGRIIGRTSNTC